MGTVCGAEGITVVDVSYLVKGSMEFFELIRIGLDLVPSAQAALTSELTLHQLHRPAKRLFDNRSRWCYR